MNGSLVLRQLSSFGPSPGPQSPVVILFGAKLFDGPQIQRRGALRISRNSLHTPLHRIPVGDGRVHRAQQIRRQGPMLKDPVPGWRGGAGIPHTPPSLSLGRVIGPIKMKP